MPFKIKLMMTQTELDAYLTKELPEPSDVLLEGWFS
jgi:hypothetical protein